MLKVSLKRGRKEREGKRGHDVKKRDDGYYLASTYLVRHEANIELREIAVQPWYRQASTL